MLVLHPIFQQQAESVEYLLSCRLQERHSPVSPAWRRRVFLVILLLHPCFCAASKQAKILKWHTYVLSPPLWEISFLFSLPMSALVLCQTAELILHLSKCKPRRGSLPSQIHYKTSADLTHMGWWIFLCLLLSLLTTATGGDDCLSLPSFSSHNYKPALKYCGG